MKRTALKRKTPLRAKRWGIGPSKKKRSAPLGNTRPLVLAREHGRCEVCGQPIRGDEWEDHHVFYRSHLNKTIRHELWNRTPLHDPCHDKAHESPAIRARLESSAVQRLFDYLGPEQLERVLALVEVGATTDAAFVRAYEQYSRSIK